MQKQKITFQQPRHLKALKCFAWVYNMTFEPSPDGGISILNRETHSKTDCERTQVVKNLIVFWYIIDNRVQ